MFVTYFYGCYWLPAFLTLLDFDVVKLGKPAPANNEKSGIMGAEEPLPATTVNI